MAMVVVMVLISQDAFVGSADFVTAFVIVDGTERALPAASDLMTILIIMVGVCSQQAGTAVSDLVPVLVIMVRAIRQDARTAENLLYRFRLLSKQRREQETVPAPKYMKVCPRFCYYGCWIKQRVVPGTSDKSDTQSQQQ